MSIKTLSSFHFHLINALKRQTAPISLSGSSGADIKGPSPFLSSGGNGSGSGRSCCCFLNKSTFSSSSSSASSSSHVETGRVEITPGTSGSEPGAVEDHFDFSKSFTKSGSEKWRSNLVSTMLVYPDFISLDEQTAILKEIEPYLSRMHYESSHWDDAIHDYRETERSKWNKTNEMIINRIRDLAFPPGVPQLKLVHILDLSKKGVIKPHIDSVRFCGNTITGLSLLSDSVMRLRHDVQKDFYCDIFLPRLSLYVMKEFARYEFTHEILGEENSKFQEQQIQRDRRISIMCRNEPEAASPTGEGPVFTPLPL